MDNFFQSLTSDTLLSILSILLGLLGTILAIVFYVKSKKNKKPFYIIRSFNIISDNFENRIKDIQILYKKQIIENLTISKIVIWNDGNETINRSDIPEATKFKIEIKNDYKIYDAECLYNTDKVNKLQIIEQGDGFILDFDFLDPKQGFIVKVTHSGKNSDAIQLSGRVKGGFFLNQVNLSIPILNSRLNRTVREQERILFMPYFKYVMLTFGIGVTVFSVVAHDSLLIRIPLLLLALPYLPLSLILIFEKKMPKNIATIYETE
jgi:hypothetical protein